MPLKPPMPPQFVEIFPNTPAAQSGLLVNDLVTAVNNKPVNDWDSFLAILQHSPGQKLQLTIARNQQKIMIPITVGTKTNWLGQKYGYIGVKEIMPQWTTTSLRKRQYSFFGALLPAAGEVYFFTQYNLVVLQKLLSGVISLQSLGGPLSIFKGTLIAANHGLVAYMIFVAFISISLCIINLLPIPGLDGCQLIYFLVEKLRGGKPVSLAVQVLMFRLGVIALILLLFQGLVNDLLRIVT